MHMNLLQEMTYGNRLMIALATWKVNARIIKALFSGLFESGDAPNLDTRFIMVWNFGRRKINGVSLTWAFLVSGSKKYGGAIC